MVCVRREHRRCVPAQARAIAAKFSGACAGEGERPGQRGGRRPPRAGAAQEPRRRGCRAVCWVSAHFGFGVKSNRVLCETAFGAVLNNGGLLRPGSQRLQFSPIPWSHDAMRLSSLVCAQTIGADCRRPLSVGANCRSNSSIEESDREVLRTVRKGVVVVAGSQVRGCGVAGRAMSCASRPQGWPGWRRTSFRGVLRVLAAYRAAMKQVYPTYI